MMDPLSLVTGILGTVFTASAPLGYLWSRIAAAEVRISAHEASDEATLNSINTTLTDLKTGQREHGQKLDRLIERFL